MAFIRNEDRIKAFIEDKKAAKKKKFDEAKLLGNLLECQCCYDSEVMVDDVVYCPKDHVFCSECVVK